MSNKEKPSLEDSEKDCKLPVELTDIDDLIEIEDSDLESVFAILYPDINLSMCFYNIPTKGKAVGKEHFLRIFLFTLEGLSEAQIAMVLYKNFYNEQKAIKNIVNIVGVQLHTKTTTYGKEQLKKYKYKKLLRKILYTGVWEEVNEILKATKLSLEELFQNKHGSRAPKNVEIFPKAVRLFLQVLREPGSSFDSVQNQTRYTNLRLIFSKEARQFILLSTRRSKTDWTPKIAKRTGIKLKDVLSGEDYIPEEYK